MAVARTQHYAEMPRACEPGMLERVASAAKGEYAVSCAQPLHTVKHARQITPQSGELFAGSACSERSEQSEVSGLRRLVGLRP